MPRRIIRIAKAAYGLRNTKKGRALGKAWRAGEAAAGAASLAQLLGGGSDARQIAKIKRSASYRAGNTSARTAMLAGKKGRCEKTPSGVLKCYKPRKKRRGRK